MKRILIYSLGLFLTGCNNESSSEPKSQQPKQIELDSTIIEEVIGDTLIKQEVDSSVLITDYSALLVQVKFFKPEEISFLQIYFSDSLILAYDFCQTDIANIKTDKDFGLAYTKLLNITTLLANSIYKLELYKEETGDEYPYGLMEQFKLIDEAVIGVQSDCVAECTEFDFTFDLTELKPFAIASEGEVDDLFFEILDLADGEYGGTGYGWHNWFSRTWDYGGGTEFGTGIHIEVLQKINLLKDKTPIYNNLLERYQSSLLNDITHGIYMRSKEETTAELKQILALEYLTSEEKVPLQKLLSDWESEIEDCENCVDKKYQFGCETGDCNWGG